MKQFLLLITISILFAAFTVNKYSSVDITKLVVTIPELTTSDLQEKLEIDFSNLSGVIKCETSIMTKTLMMKYDDKKVSLDEIQSVFQKWGCAPDEYSYQKLH
jgi:hypothetical protein